ncbi:MAG: cation:proton antiporter, partial [Moorea sp. SIO2B7]|nr:cation:proton antiporter [Moorena sp. SIO2B7]
LSTIAAFYVAISLTFSSTIIIVKLFSDKREIDALHGRIALGVLIVQDIVVVLVMIALAALGGNDQQASLGQAILIMFLKGGTLLILVGLAIRYLLPNILHSIARSTELLILFAITWAIALAAFSDALGFSKEVGAFLAGFSLASTPYRAILGARLVSLRDFLLLFFFINLGIHIDITHLGAELLPALIFSAFVLIAKPIMLMALVGAMGYRKYTSALTSFSLNQISEFSLILAALGVSLGHIDEEVMGLITLVGLITMGLSTYMILYSHVLYNWLAPYLNRFEINIHHHPKTVADVPDLHLAEIDVILFGLGRYGGSMVKHLRQHGLKVLGVDFDPEIVKFWRKEGLLTFYGDAEDPEFAAILPLNKAQWVVSTIPGQHIGLTLLHALKHNSFSGRVAVTSHNLRDLEILKEADADLVLLPFRDAATEAARTLAELIT